MNFMKFIQIPGSRALIRSTTIYTSANLLNMGIPFLMLPVLTRYLSPYDYGLVATFQAMRTICMIAVRMGTGDAISRAYYDRDKRGFDFHKYIFNAVLVIAGVFLLLFIILSLTSGVIEAKLIFPATWVLFVPILALTDAITSIPLKLWVFKEMPIQYSMFQVSKAFLDISLSLFLVIRTGLLWKGRILGIGIVEIFAMIISLFYLVRNRFLVYSIDYSYIKKILRYGVPVFIHSLSFWVIGSMDRFFINNMVGISTTGVYSVSYTIAGIIGLLAGSFSMAWTPIFYEKLKASETDSKKRIVRFTYIYFICMLLLAATLTALAPYLLNIVVGKAFYGAERYIIWIAFGAAFQGMYMMVCGYVFYSKKTYMMARITSTVAVINVVLTYSLIKINGGIGAAQATFLSYLLSFLLTWWTGNRVYPMNWFPFQKAVAKIQQKE